MRRESSGRGVRPARVVPGATGRARRRADAAPAAAASRIRATPAAGAESRCSSADRAAAPTARATRRTARRASVLAADTVNHIARAESVRAITAATASAATVCPAAIEKAAPDDHRDAPAAMPEPAMLERATLRAGHVGQPACRPSGHSGHGRGRRLAGVNRPERAPGRTPRAGRPGPARGRGRRGRSVHRRRLAKPRARHRSAVTTTRPRTATGACARSGALPPPARCPATDRATQTAPTVRERAWRHRPAYIVPILADPCGRCPGSGTPDIPADQVSVRPRSGQGWVSSPPAPAPGGLPSHHEPSIRPLPWRCA